MGYRRANWTETISGWQLWYWRDREAMRPFVLIAYYGGLLSRNMVLVGIDQQAPVKGQDSLNSA